MKSSIRSGDFKLYKRYATNDYELYKLYKDGERNDIEEANPYLNPEYAGHKKPSAKIAESNFDAAGRQAKLSVKSSGPAIKKAYVIYRALEPGSKHRSREYKSKPDDARLPGMRAPAQIGEDGFSISAAIPEGIPAFCFSVIDANGYKQYSNVVEVK